MAFGGKNQKSKTGAKGDAYYEGMPLGFYDGISADQLICETVIPDPSKGSRHTIRYDCYVKGYESGFNDLQRYNWNGKGPPPEKPPINCNGGCYANPGIGCTDNTGWEDICCGCEYNNGNSECPANEMLQRKTYYWDNTNTVCNTESRCWCNCGCGNGCCSSNCDGCGDDPPDDDPCDCPGCPPVSALGYEGNCNYCKCELNTDCITFNDPSRHYMWMMTFEGNPNYWYCEDASCAELINDPNYCNIGGDDENQDYPSLLGLATCQAISHYQFGGSNVSNTCDGFSASGQDGCQSVCEFLATDCGLPASAGTGFCTGEGCC